jgi:adenylate kinase
VRGPEHSSPFSAFASAKAKFLLLGQSGPLSADLINQGRSLHLEHVSPALLVQQEISRRTRSALPRDVNQLHLALLRKWFWARKPDAGFLLEGFPATMLQALVFDEWLEARGETLNGVFISAEPSSIASWAKDDVVTHYRTQGLTPVSLSVAA